MSDPGPERRPRPDPAGTPGPGGSTVSSGRAPPARCEASSSATAPPWRSRTSASTSPPARSTPWWARTARASRRWARSSPARWRPTRARSWSTASRSAIARRATRSATASGSSSRSSRSRPTCRCSTTSSSASSWAAAASSTARQQRERFAELAERIGFRPRPSATVRTLRTADQQKVEILRQLVRDTRLIVMDEPTAALTRDEADRLLEITRELRDDGVTVIYVSHILGDVLALCDTVTVLKDGRHVQDDAGRPRRPPTALVTAMLGRSLDVAFPTPTPPPADAPVVLVGARAQPAAGLRRHLLRGARRGDRRARRPGGQRPHGDRTRHLRRRSMRGHGRARRAGADRALPAVEHPARHGAAPREPQGPGPRHGPAAERERHHGPRRHASRAAACCSVAASSGVVGRHAAAASTRARARSRCRSRRCRAATSRRRRWPSGWSARPSCCSPTSPRAASTWGPSAPSTTSSTAWPRTVSGCCSSPASSARCWASRIA